MKQRTEVTFEIEETVVLKQGGKFLTSFCPLCEQIVTMASPDVLALLTGSGEREIFRLVEAGRIHFVEADRIYACLGCYRNSIKESRNT